MERAELYGFLRLQRLGVVSSVGPEGTPQSALVGVAVSPELAVIFDTMRDARKYRNLTARPACSVVLGWSGEQTVQMEGVAEEPAGAELERLREVYFAAWPDGRARLARPGLVHLVVRPRWLRYSDYDQRPPQIEEIRLGGESSRFGCDRKGAS